MLGKSKSVVSLPLLLVVDHKWRLLFACNRGFHIDILSSLRIRDTESIRGIYRIIAVLRAIAG